MQNYQTMPDTKKLNESRLIIVNNFLTALSQNSGTAFPTLNLEIGMPCYRTDQKKLYVLTATGPDVWELLFDMNFTPTTQEAVDTALAGKSDTEHTHAYLPLAGGELTNAVDINYNGGEVRIAMAVGGRFYIAPNDDGDFQWTREFGYDPTTNNWYVETNLDVVGDVTSGGNRCLTTADEGAGNGLDADTVDGKQASEFLGVTAKAADSSKWDGANKTVSTGAPTGGASGDIWLQYE